MPGIFSSETDKKNAEKLYRAHRNDALKIARGILKDKSAAEDCAAEAFVRLGYALGYACGGSCSFGRKVPKTAENKEKPHFSVWFLWWRRIFQIRTKSSIDLFQ